MCTNKKESQKFKPSQHLPGGRSVAPGCKYIHDENCFWYWSLVPSKAISGFSVEKKLSSTLTAVGEQEVSISSYHKISIQCLKLSSNPKLLQFHYFPQRHMFLATLTCLHLQLQLFLFPYSCLHVFITMMVVGQDKAVESW